jgi:RNA polymerase sigma-70 factor, ECF subfamily
VTVNPADWPAEQFEAQVFEEHRVHLRSVAYRMLGSLAEADDAVQEAWLRMSRAGTDDVRDLRAWLTTVVSRVCLDMLRTRASRREQSLDADPDVHVPDPVVTRVDDVPEEHAVLADSVGIALLVVLDTLSPAERLAFVLHDIFAVPFEEIAAILGRSPDAAKQLANRARRRLRGPAVPAATPSDAAEAARQRRVVAAFQAAAMAGDFEALLTVLDPDVVLRADVGAAEAFGPSQVIRGAQAVSAQARRFAPLGRYGHQVVVNGGPGFLVAPDGQPFALLAMTVQHDRITEIDILADPVRLARLDLMRLIDAAPATE